MAFVALKERINRPPCACLLTIDGEIGREKSIPGTRGHKTNTPERHTRSGKRSGVCVSAKHFQHGSRARPHKLRSCVILLLLLYVKKKNFKGVLLTVLKTILKQDYSQVQRHNIEFLPWSSPVWEDLATVKKYKDHVAGGVLETYKILNLGSACVSDPSLKLCHEEIKYLETSSS